MNNQSVIVTEDAERDTGIFSWYIELLLLSALDLEINLNCNGFLSFTTKTMWAFLQKIFNGSPQLLQTTAEPTPLPSSLKIVIVGASGTIKQILLISLVSEKHLLLRSSYTDDSAIAVVHAQ
jgi:hypothetical protein